MKKTLQPNTKTSFSTQFSLNCSIFVFYVPNLFYNPTAPFMCRSFQLAEKHDDAAYFSITSSRQSHTVWTDQFITAVVKMEALKFSTASFQFCLELRQRLHISTVQISRLRCKGESTMALDVRAETHESSPYP